MLRQVIEKAGEAGEESDWIAASGALSSLGELCQVSPEQREEISRYLFDIAETAEQGRVKKLFKKDAGPPPRALTSLAYALGKAGGSEAVEHLKKMAASKDKGVARQAATELKNIERIMEMLKGEEP
jgi:hypothetical protein